MQWLDDIVYTNEFLESLDKDCFPLTYKMFKEKNYMLKLHNRNGLRKPMKINP